MQTDVHKTLYFFYTTKKMSHVKTAVTKMRFVGRNSQAYYDNLHNGLSADFQTGYFFFKEALRWSLTKPQITILFYLVSLVSVT